MNAKNGNEDIDFATLTARAFHPSPAAWEDEVFYFFLVDRFSDGQERDFIDNSGAPATSGATPRLRAEDRGNAVQNEADAAAWREAGARFVGGTLKGATSKIGYLKRLGVTAVWVSPVFKQPPWAESYHGYGVQDFLDVDPRFGTPSVAFGPCGARDASKPDFEILAGCWPRIRTRIVAAH